MEERGNTRSFLARELANPVSPLVVSAQLSLSAEFPDQVQARAVLAAIGSGERTFTNIARAAGGIAHSTLTRATDLLISKGVVAGDLPISLAPSKERRYRTRTLTCGSGSRFSAHIWPSWTECARTLRWIASPGTGPRGVGAPSNLSYERHWHACCPLKEYRPHRQSAATGPAATTSRSTVGADREPVARQLLFLGSVKWLETAQFDDHDLVELQRHRDRVTSEPVPLIAISRTGTATSRADAAFGPEGLLEAWLRLWSSSQWD